MAVRPPPSARTPATSATSATPRTDGTAELKDGGDRLARSPSSFVGGCTHRNPGYGPCRTSVRRCFSEVVLRNFCIQMQFVLAAFGCAAGNRAVVRAPLDSESEVRIEVRRPPPGVKLDVEAVGLANGGTLQIPL